MGGKWLREPAMHQYYVAQGFSGAGQARSTFLSGDPSGDRIHRSNLCDYEERHVSVLLGEQAKSQAHYQNRAAGG